MSQVEIQNDVPDVPVECDVCIIGSGAAGCVLAYELSKNGNKIVVMEKGDHYTIDWIREAAGKKDEHSLSSLWKNSGIFLSQDFSVNIAQGQCVGGSTMINYGICFDMPDAVFHYWKDSFGITILKNDIDDAFRRVRDQSHVQRIIPKEAGRSHQKLELGCQRLGYRGDWMEKAIMQGQKQSAYLVYLQNADFSNIRLFANCTAEKILIKGKRAVGATGIAQEKKTGQKKRLTVHAKNVIISAGPIASSEILLKNKLDQNDQVGRHLSIHPVSSVVAEFDERLDGDEDFAMAYYCDEFSVLKTERPGVMIESVFVPPSQYSIITPSFGAENKEYLKNYNNAAMAGVLVHDEPSGKISLNWSGDAIVNYTLSDTDQKKMIDGLKETCRIFLRAGAKRVITGHIQKTIISNIEDLRLVDKRGSGTGSLLVASAHPQGGNRMGEDRSTSVVNSHCEMHEISNLYICDASIFPTSLGVNPQLTVMALATLVADYIKKQ